MLPHDLAANMKKLHLITCIYMDVWKSNYAKVSGK